MNDLEQIILAKLEKMDASLDTIKEDFHAIDKRVSLMENKAKLIYSFIAIIWGSFGAYIKTKFFRDY